MMKVILIWRMQWKDKDDIKSSNNMHSANNIHSAKKLWRLNSRGSCTCIFFPFHFVSNTPHIQHKLVLLLQGRQETWKNLAKIYLS